MKHVSRAIRLAGLFALVATALASAPVNAQQRVTVGVVTDGAVAGRDFIERVRAELEVLLSDRATVTFKQIPSFNANWDAGRAEQVIRAAMTDPDVDYVVGIGMFVTHAASRPDVELPKPFISAFVQRTPLFNVPGADTDRQKPNFAFIIIPRSVERDLEALTEMDALSKVYILVGDQLLPLMKQLEDDAKVWLKREAGLDFEVVGVEPGLPNGLADLPLDAKAVYLARTPRFSRDQRRQLIDALNARGLATFSLIGHSDVELGALAGLMPDIEQLVVRRVALNITALMRGESTADLPTIMSVDTRLIINGRTAKSIGYMPSFETMALAEIIDIDALESDAQPLDFAGALALAEDRNIDLYVKDANVESSFRQKQVARSPLLPQVDADAGYMRSEPFLPNGILPTELSNVGLSVSQMIFDDKAISNFRSTGREYEANVLDREVVRLDVMQETGVQFLQFVLSRLLVRVDADNVQLTADNLELAQVRYDVGYSGRDEVFRWRAELAGQRSSLLNSASNMESSRIAFNQVVGVEMERQWIPREVEVDPNVFFFLRGRLDDLYRNVMSRAGFREAIVQIAIDNAPELGFFQKAIEAQGIQVGLKKRSFIIPSLVLDFRYNYALDWQPNVGARDDSYRFQVSALYPLFRGGNRYYDMRKQQAELVGLESERERARQLVERRARTSFMRVENSFPIIALSQEAAENAIRNLGVVRDKYGQGIVNVTDLLQAQNSAFVAQQNAAAATYTFLTDLVELHRAIAWFESDYSEAELDDMIQRIRDLVDAN